MASSDAGGSAGDGRNEAELNELDEIEEVEEGDGEGKTFSVFL